MSNNGADTRSAPRPPTTVAAGATAHNLSSYIDSPGPSWVTVCAVGGALTMRFGDASVGAATATDWPLASGEKESFIVSTATIYVSIQGVGDLCVVKG